MSPIFKSRLIRVRPSTTAPGVAATPKAPDLDVPKTPLPTTEKSAGAAAPSPPPTLRTPEGAQPFGGERPLGGGSSLGLTLRRVEYRATPIRAGSEMIVPGADEKLLVVRFSLRNPGCEETWVDYSCLSFIAVDALGMNRECCGDLLNEQTGESMNTSLLPGQRIDAYAVITLPARGPDTGLVALGADGNLLEYPLAGAVAALEPPFADPADPTGASALAQVPMATGTAFPVESLAVTVERVVLNRDRIQKRRPGRGNQFLTVSLRVKNVSPEDQQLYCESLDFALRSPQGADVPWNQELLASGREDVADSTLTPGRETTARIYFEVPQGLGPLTLFARRGEGARAYLVDLGAAQ
jgi:hypothetical protein